VANGSLSFGIERWTRSSALNRSGRPQDADADNGVRRAAEQADAADEAGASVGASQLIRSVRRTWRSMARTSLASLLILLAATCASPEPATESSRCKLPEADQRNGAPAPTLDGSIQELRGSCFRINPRRTTLDRPAVCLTGSTRIFTVYGGHVAADQLRDGQRVHVWLKGCKPPVAGAPSEAVVIELASRTPGEDFP
jgi:hypothetical protein